MIQAKLALIKLPLKPKVIDVVFPGVPRVGDFVADKGDLLTVKRIIWKDDGNNTMELWIEAGD